MAEIGRSAWVSTKSEVEGRRVDAGGLVGLEFSAVRYVTLDYRRSDFAPEFSGPRSITDASEWREPTWEFDDCDSADFGVEFTTSRGRVFSVTWDALGVHESVGLHEGSLLGERFSGNSDVAVWEVGARSRWLPLLGEPVGGVDLHYEPWADEGFWCPRITLRFGSRRIELLLGEGRKGGRVGPAANNVAVLFDPEELPQWLRGESK
jgi:hypothetical protein